MSEQPRRINTGRAAGSGRNTPSGTHSSTGASRTARSTANRSASAGTHRTAAGRRKRKKMPVWLPLVVALAIIGAGAGAVLHYVNGIMEEMAPESGTAQIAEEVKTAEAYAGDVVGFLVCGIDYSGSETGTADGSNDGMTDLIMYFQFDVKNNKINMLQIPRNTFVGSNPVGVTGTKYKASNGQINSIMKSNLSDNGKGSIAALADVIAADYKLPIDYYACLDMDALKELVTRFGGVEVYVPTTIEYKGSRIEEGYHTLNADEVEFLVRNRKTYADGDISRLNMQRYFYAGLFKRVRTASVAEIIKLMPVMTYFVETDCNASTLVSIGVSLLNCDSANIMVCQTPVYNANEFYNGNSVVVAARDQIAELLNQYFRDYTGAVSVDQLDLADWSHGSTATSANVQYMGQLDQQAEEAVAAGDTTVTN